jgi:hypothetical protein
MRVDWGLSTTFFNSGPRQMKQTEGKESSGRFALAMKCGSEEIDHRKMV